MKNPAQGIPATSALSCKNNINARVVLPELQAVGIGNLMQIDRLIEELFIVGVGARVQGRRSKETYCE
jgi:hypothetical protein